MFKLTNLTDTYEYDVKMKLPGTGSKTEYTIRVKYYRLPHDERQALLRKISEMDATATPLEQMVALEEYTSHMIDKVFAGWADNAFQDENGAWWPDTDENKAKMLNVSEFRTAVFKGYQDSQGDKKSTEGKLKA